MTEPNQPDATNEHPALQPAAYRAQLLDDVLPFWIDHAIDREHGGFTTFLDQDGSLLSTDKPMWVQGRFVWLLARLYNTLESRREWLELARHGLDFIAAHGFDHDGRMFYSVTRDGRPLRKRRYLFTETFAAIGFAEYARAAGDDQARTRARELFHLIHHYHTTPGLLEPKVNPVTRPLKGHAMPMILLATAQVLREADDDPLYEQVIEASICELRDHFVHPELEALLETVGPDGAFLDNPEGRIVNPGHAIESAWFLMHEAQRRDDGDLLALALRILNWSLTIGWDSEFGGIYYFRDVRGLPCEQYEHDMKLWWPHTEAIYATLLAHRLTGQPQYRAWCQRIHDWAYAHFPDPEHGEWFGYLHRDGTRSTRLKGNMWKGPFHLPRMLLNCWTLLRDPD